MKGRDYGDFKLWKDLNAQKNEIKRAALNFIRLLGFQTLLTLIIQIVGYYKTKRTNLFWWTQTAFILLTIAYLILELLLAITPSGPLI